MIRAGRPRQRFHGSFLKQPRDRAPLGANLGEGQLGGPFTGDHHEIDYPFPFCICNDLPTQPGA